MHFAFQTRAAGIGEWWNAHKRAGLGRNAKSIAEVFWNWQPQRKEFRVRYRIGRKKHDD